MTPDQVTAARHLLGWSRDKLASASGVPLTSLKQFELWNGQLAVDRLTAIDAALVAAGIEFTEGKVPGVSIRQTHTTTRDDLEAKIAAQKAEVVRLAAGKHFDAMPEAQRILHDLKAELRGAVTRDVHRTKEP